MIEALRRIRPILRCRRAAVEGPGLASHATLTFGIGSRIPANDSSKCRASPFSLHRYRHRRP